MRSVNQLNRVHIALENVMTPMLAWQLAPQITASPATSLLAIRDPAPDSHMAATLGQQLYVSAEEWRERLIRHMMLAGKAVPEKYARRRLKRDVFLFSDPGAKGIKRLLIVFAGGAMRPMMPLHAFLQHLDAAKTDVLFLRDPKRDGFRGGLFGVGGSLEEVVARLPELLEQRSFDALSTLGTSAGGVPALLAGLALGARSVLSVGGSRPDRWEFGGRPVAESLASLRHGTGRNSKIFLMLGAQSPEDQFAAEATASILGATILAVSDRDSPVRHGALFPLAQQGRLALVLEALLLASVDTLPLIAPSIGITDVARQCRT